MKLTSSLLLICFCLTAGWAQSPKIYGIWRAGQGPWGNATTVPIAQMDLTTGLPITIDSIQNVNAVVLGSSTFDQANQEYIFSGPDLTTGAQIRVFRFNVANGGVINTPALGETVNEYQYDMQQQKLFGLGGYIVDTTGPVPDYRTRLLAVNTLTGNVTELFQFPEIGAVVVGSSTFNSDSAQIIFEGRDSLGVARMYVIDVLTGAILQNAPLTNPANTFFNDWEYDHNLGKLYGLYRDNNVNILGFVEYDLTSNTYTVLDTITGLIGLTPSASVYDHATSTYVFTGVDNNSGNRLISIDAVAGQVASNVVLNGYYIELECDNSAFGDARYGSIGLDEPENLSLSVYPNPSRGSFTVEGPEGVYRLMDVQGRVVGEYIVPQGTRSKTIETPSRGVFILVHESGAQNKVMVQ